jgi:hypothetical protein
MIRLKPPSTLLAMALVLAPARAEADPGQRQPSPQALWESWRSGAPLATCVTKATCPPRDQAGRAVKSCYYESGFETGFRCIVFCEYGGPSPWGSDGGSHCD